MRKYSTSSLVIKIDEAFDRRDLIMVHRLLPALTARCKRDNRWRARAAEFLLRLPDPSGAFRLLSGHEDLTAESRLCLANAANFLGASKYALRVLDSVPKNVRSKHRVETGQILATNYLDETLDYLANEGTSQRPKPAPGPQGESALLLRCYRLLALNRFDELYAICDFFLQGSFSAGRKAFALIFVAWAQVEQGYFEAAARSLKRFEDMPSLGFAWPHTLFHMVSALLFTKEKDYSKAQKHLVRAWDMAYQPGLQPEASWLYVLFLQGNLSYQKSGGFPSEWARILAYPMIASSYADLIAQQTPLPQELLLDFEGVRKSQAPLHFHLQEDRAVIAKRPRLGLTADQRLLGYLVSGGRYGVPLFRLLDVLWPEEPLSLRTHLKRLEQAVRRLREQEYEILWHRNHLWLKSPGAVSVLWRGPNQKGLSPDHFLSGRSRFRRHEVQLHFAISERTAKRVCQDWIARKLIVPQGLGPSTYYVVV